MSKFEKLILQKIIKYDKKIKQAAQGDVFMVLIKMTSLPIEGLVAREIKETKRRKDRNIVQFLQMYFL